MLETDRGIHGLAFMMLKRTTRFKTLSKRFSTSISCLQIWLQSSLVTSLVIPRWIHRKIWWKVRESLKRAALSRLINSYWFYIRTLPGIFDSLSNLWSTTYQAPSYIRFYCDNDAHDSPTARWQLVPDRADDPTPNSQKTLNVDQEWFDQYNYMRVSTTVPFRCLYQDPRNPDMKNIAYVARTAINDEGFTYNGIPLPDRIQKYRSVVTVSSRILIPFWNSQIYNRS